MLLFVRFILVQRDEKALITALCQAAGTAGESPQHTVPISYETQLKKQALINFIKIVLVIELG